MVCQHIWACSKEVVSKSPDNTVEINYSSPSSSAGCSGDSTSNSESISETLYLLEKFRVSDECYHELTMIHPQLPRSYKVIEEIYLALLNFFLYLHHMLVHTGLSRLVLN